MKDFLEKTLQENIIDIKSIEGGDISEAFKIITSKGSYFCKQNSSQDAERMFTVEAKSLIYLDQNSSFDVPKSIVQGKTAASNFIVLEWFESSDSIDYRKFGTSLANLHNNTNSTFGFAYDSYLGTHLQNNQSYQHFHEHYISGRILPLIQSNFNKALLSKEDMDTLDNFMKYVPEILPNESPSLIHGDLWSGNHMFIDKGIPCIFDPAISFSSREFDIGMMLLFGSFPSECYDSYNENFPLTAGWKERVPYFQLYYLLLHLDMFGSQYHSRVMQCVKKFRM